MTGDSTQPASAQASGKGGVPCPSTTTNRSAFTRACSHRTTDVTDRIPFPSALRPGPVNGMAARGIDCVDTSFSAAPPLPIRSKSRFVTVASWLFLSEAASFCHMLAARSLRSPPVRTNPAPASKRRSCLASSAATVLLHDGTTLTSSRQLGGVTSHCPDTHALGCGQNGGGTLNPTDSHPLPPVSRLRFTF
jgi:hypothetical protein